MLLKAAATIFAALALTQPEPRRNQPEAPRESPEIYTLIDIDLTDAAKVLDDFHDAASKADEARYFAHLAPDAVFLGTDATERWTREEFLAFAHPYFSQGKGWTYHARDRHLNSSPDGQVAWFDELLDNDKLGVCRGSGVLRKVKGTWLIEQYNLSIPIPNDLATDFAAKIADFTKSHPPAGK